MTIDTHQRPLLEAAKLVAGLGGLTLLVGALVAAGLYYQHDTVPLLWVHVTGWVTVAFLAAAAVTVSIHIVGGN